MLDVGATEALIRQSKVPENIRAKLEEFGTMPLELMVLGISNWDADIKISFLSSSYLKPALDFVKQATATGERITEGAQYLLIFVGVFLVLFVAYVYRFFLSPIFSELSNLHEEVIRANEQEIHFEKLRVLGQISGGVAHEFNNVLNIISGNAEMALLKGEGGKDNSRYVEKILETSIRTATLTDQLLMYSRRRHLNEVHVNLKRFFENLEKNVLPVIGKEVRFTLVNDLEASVYVDPVFFETSVVNLITNARDALARTEDGCIEVRAAATDQGLIRISVVDNGPGIPEEMLPLIREPFYSTKRLGRGTGLGLAMVEGFAAQSSGRLEISSRPGRTETVLLLPVSHPQGPDALVASRHRETPVYLAGVSILVVEDRLDEFEFLIEHLKAGGCKIGTARSVVEAIAQKDTKWDVVLCDIDLGEGTGLDVYQEFQRDRSGPPFVFMTGNMPSEFIRDEVAKTRQRVLTKPFTMADMVEALKAEVHTTSGQSRQTT